MVTVVAIAGTPEGGESFSEPVRSADIIIRALSSRACVIGFMFPTICPCREHGFYDTLAGLLVVLFAGNLRSNCHLWLSSELLVAAVQLAYLGAEAAGASSA